MNRNVIAISCGIGAAGTPVTLEPKKGNIEPSQLWYLDDHGIIHSALNDLVMEPSVADSKIKMMEYNGFPLQQWKFEGNRISSSGGKKYIDIVNCSEIKSTNGSGASSQLWAKIYV
jgi:hypothetical protein